MNINGGYSVEISGLYPPDAVDETSDKQLYNMMLVDGSF